MSGFLLKLYENIISSLTNMEGVADYMKIEQANLDLMMPLWDYLAIIAMGLTLVYFLMEVNRKFALEGGDLNFKSMFSPFLKLFIALVILTQAKNIVAILCNINNAFIDEGVNLIKKNTNPEGSDLIEETLKKVNFFTAIGMLLPMLLGWLCGMLIKIVWIYKAFMVKLEFVFRIGITPIACADIYSGQNSNAVKYLKGFLVLGITAIGIIFLPYIATMSGFIKLSVDTSGFDANPLNILSAIAITTLVAPFAALSCASAIKQVAKEALGA